MTTLGYWGIRGLAQPIRFLLAYLGVEYTDKRYLNPEEWFSKDKTGLGFDFPNIPYFIDGDVKLTESSAIPVYLIKKHNRPELLGQNADGTFNVKEARVQQLLGVLEDIDKELVTICFNPDFNTVKDKLYTEKLEAAIKRFIAFLGDKEFLVGTLTYADFKFYEMLGFTSNIFPQSVTPTITAFITRFENLHGVKEYIATHTAALKVFLLGEATWTGPQ